ncbi:MAG: LysR family transcriptional regulator [Notoacmeibacter sp.]|nr:LysR family transcriptional regulator [Notoacmeibacter sp.]
MERKRLSKYANEKAGKPKVDISLLQTFHLVARTGSFSAASRELNISYQSASNHVRRLEQMYGQRLIEAEKGARKVQLTPQGKALHASLGEELDTILSRIAVLMHDVRSVLRVGVPQALFHHFFPDVLRLFRMAEPDIELVFFERDTTLERMMMDGALDAAVSERSFSQAAISQHLLGAYHLALIYPREWTEETFEDGDLGFFSDRPFITYEPGQTIRTRAIEYLSRRFDEPPRIVTTASGSTSVTRLVESGLGYAVVPEWSVTENHPATRRIVLQGIEPMKVYFAHTAFLETNGFIRLLHKSCTEAMASAFRAQ